MKQILNLIGLLMVLSQAGWCDTGNSFKITGSGTATTLDIVLCLNGKGPLSCQNYTVTRRTLSILSIRPSHTYPSAGIKITTPGYAPSGCTLYSNGYCLFPVSDTTAAVITAIPTDTSNILTSIDPISGTVAGGTGFTLTGTNLAGATGVTFGGAAATSVNVRNATTVTGVTPAHAAGAVDVVITTPQGTGTLTNGFTYQAVAIGQSTGGGVIACLQMGNNLIAATANAPTTLVWTLTDTVTGATSTTNGAQNTQNIVGTDTGINYAAGYCENYQVDSQGNSPCAQENACYEDWFLPAGQNATDSGQLNCLFENRTTLGIPNGFYWSSTQFGFSATEAWLQEFGNGLQLTGPKSGLGRVRCVRTFTP